MTARQMAQLTQMLHSMGLKQLERIGNDHLRIHFISRDPICLDIEVGPTSGQLIVTLHWEKE